MKQTSLQAKQPVYYDTAAQTHPKMFQPHSQAFPLSSFFDRLQYAKTEAYCKRSKTGHWEGLGMRLTVYQSIIGVNLSKALSSFPGHSRLYLSFREKSGWEIDSKSWSGLGMRLSSHTLVMHTRIIHTLCTYLYRAHTSGRAQLATT